MQWQYLNKSKIKDFNQLKKILLLNRQVTNDKQEKEFWDFRSPFSYDLNEVGFDTKQLNFAFERLKQALKRQEKVLIYGDYDMDGISATAILWLSLKKIGLITQPFIPHRIKHGYGMTKKALSEILAKEKFDLVITVDNGIVAFEACEFLKEKKIDLIITDHHQIENQKQKPIYPFCVAYIHNKEFCGALVVWFFMNYFYDFSGVKDKENFLLGLLDLAGLATLADQMVLLGINRQVVKMALNQLRKTENMGLNCLVNKLNLDLTQLDEKKANFKIIPCLNAAGRIDHGLEALRLLCTKNLNRAIILSEKLNTLNSSRKDLTNELWLQALSMVKKQLKNKFLFLISKNYHEGVIGLLASRLVEKFNCLTFVGCQHDNEIKVSARSVGDIDLMKILVKIKHLCLSLGGHKGAAGFSFSLSNLNPIMKILSAEISTYEQKSKKIIIESKIDFQLLNYQLLELLKKLSPFGKGNPELILSIRVKVLASQFIGKEKKHLKLIVNDGIQDKQMNIFWWNQADNFKLFSLVNQELEIIFTPSINEFRGKESLQLIGLDVKKC